MKRTFGLVVIIAVISLLSSCSALKKMDKRAGEINYSITPETLTVKGGMVDLRMDVTFPERYFNRKVTLQATPVLRFANGEEAYEVKTLQGEKVQGNAEVVPFERGKTVSYYSTIPYRDAMRISTLEMDMVGSKGAKTHAFAPRKIGEGVIATETLVENNPAIAIGEDKFQRIIAQQEEAAIYFLINSADLRSKELTSQEMKMLQQYIKDAYAQENVNLNNIDIRSYASPDGAYDFNEKLANRRENNSTKHISNQLRKDKVDAYKDADFFKKYVVAEDWDGFRKEMEASNIQDKELILRVLDMHSDPEVREREIKNIASVFATVAEQVLPKLRRSRFIVNTELIGKSDEEIRNLARSNPSALNVEETLYAATLVNTQNEKLTIYQNAIRQFPNDWRGYNDAGMIQFEMGNVADAKSNFDRANGISSNNPVVQNNLAAVALINNNVPQAEVHLGAATGAGPEVDYNKGIVAIKKGNYNDAVNYFSKCTTVNAALANILAGNNREALNKLNAGEETAMAAYLKAVIAARTNDAPAVMTNLRSAVSKDSSLKRLAATDMEFARYFDNSDFESIVR